MQLVTAPNIAQKLEAIGGLTPAKPIYLLHEWEQTELLSLTQADRAALSELNARLSNSVRIEDTPGGSTLSVRQFVGIFELPSFILQVLPKSLIQPKNLVFMLARAVALKRADLPNTYLSAAPSDLQEELAHLFLQTLQAELQRGVTRHYREKEDNLPVLRGKLRVAAYLRRPHPLHLPVRYAELDGDHLLNRVFLFTLHHLARRLKDRQNLQRVALLREWLAEAGVRRVSTLPPDWEQLSLNRLQHRYQAAFQLASLLLRGMGVMQKHGPYTVPSFSFDMDRLFEQFMTRVLVEDVLKGQAHIHKQGSGLTEPHLFSESVVELKPDLVVEWPGRQPLVIDFKNKVLSKTPDSGDLHQMYVYARHLACTQVVLFYPGDFPPRTWTATGGPPLTVTARAVNLEMNLHREYGELLTQLRAHLSQEGLPL